MSIIRTRGVGGPPGWLLGLALAGVGGAGCDGPRSDDEPPAGPVEAAEPAEAAAQPQEPAPTTPLGPPSLLAGVLDDAIAPPPAGGSTYRVDAYVAALVVEQLGRDALPFTAWRNDGATQGAPAAGYRVGALAEGSLWARLGLTEGDVIEQVNGVSTAQPGWAEEALRRAENRATVEIFRDDVSFVLSYRLMGGMAWQGRVLARAPSDEGPDTGEEPSPLAEDEPERGDGVAGVGGGGGRRPSSSSGSRPSASGGSRPASGGASSPRPSAATVARCQSASRCTLGKAHFDALVRSPAKLESQVRVVPAIRNDVFSGYKLKSVRSGSAVHQLGFRSGDKVTHINGRDLTNDFEAMQLYMGLSGTRTFNVRYVRGGSARTKTIKVQ